MIKKKHVVREMSGWGNFRSGKMSSRGSLLRGSVRSGNSTHTVQKAFQIFLNSEAVLQMCYYEKVFWKNAENLQENIHAEKRFQ